VVSLHDRADVDRDDVSLLKHALARNPVDDLVVDRSANDARKRDRVVRPRVTEEGRLRSELLARLPRALVQFLRRHAGPDCRFDARMNHSDDVTRSPHAFDLALILDRDSHRQYAPIDSSPRDRWRREYP